MGEDFWPYGIAPNRVTLESFLRQHQAQGVSPPGLTIQDLFHPSTVERFMV